MNTARGTSAALIVFTALLFSALFGVTGIVGATSTVTAQSVFQTNLQLHDTGSEVLLLQKFLNA